jgi:hypothetical protein
MSPQFECVVVPYVDGWTVSGLKRELSFKTGDKNSTAIHDTRTPSAPPKQCTDPPTLGATDQKAICCPQLWKFLPEGIYYPLGGEHVPLSDPVS